MASFPFPSPLLFFPLFLSFSFFPFTIHSANGGFSVHLIHRDHSTKSPFFDSSLSPSDRLNLAIQRSVSRSRRLFSSSRPSVSSQLIPNSGEYLMSLQVGSPPSKILAIADTGSDLTWTQCQPCVSCYAQKDPIFNPKNSSSYVALPCKTDPCSHLHGECTTNGLCEYRYSYGDRSFTVGKLSSDTFTFRSEDSNDKKVAVPGILFGCSNYAYGSFDKNGGGLAGLGAGPLSLVSQLSPSFGKKFSYCLVSYTNNQNSTSTLRFGDKAVVGNDPAGAVTTPILSGDNETFYYLSLEAIRVGKEKVVVGSPSGGGGKGNIIIDSGTTLTMLEEPAFGTLMAKVKKAVGGRSMKMKGFDLCFDTRRSFGRRIKLPELVFEFGGGAAVKLPVNNSFVWVGDKAVCLGMASSGEAGFGVYGNLAQQNFHVGYDLGAKQVTFAPADCSNL